MIRLLRVRRRIRNNTKHCNKNSTSPRKEKERETAIWQNTRASVSTAPSVRVNTQSRFGRNKSVGRFMVWSRPQGKEAFSPNCFFTWFSNCNAPSSTLIGAGKSCFTHFHLLVTTEFFSLISLSCHPHVCDGFALLNVAVYLSLSLVEERWHLTRISCF